MHKLCFYFCVLQVKKLAQEQLFVGAGTIVEAEMRDAVSTLDTDQAAPALPNEDYLVRRVNRLCQNLIPKDPKDHTFKVYIY